MGSRLESLWTTATGPPATATTLIRRRPPSQARQRPWGAASRRVSSWAMERTPSWASRRAPAA